MKGSQARQIAVFHSAFDNRVKGGGEKLILKIRASFRATLIAGSIDCSAWSKKKAGEDSFIRLFWKDDLPFFFIAKESRIPIWRRFKRGLWFRISPRVHILNRYQQIIFSGDPLFVSRRIDKSVRKIYYCNTPPRHFTDQRDWYLNRYPRLFRGFVSEWLKRELARYKKDLQQMDVIITNSQNIRRRLKQYTGLDSVVAFPGIQISQYSFLGQDDYFLSYARLDEWKRIGFIVEAFKRIPEKKLIIASTGPLRAWLVKEIQGYANMSYLGLIEDKKLNVLIGRCIAGIYIPIDEDAGMTPCELMAAGKPVIGVREGGLLETIVDKETGILMRSPPIVEDLVAAIRWLTPQRALQMKEKCQVQAQKFDEISFFKKISEILNITLQP
jgi:glycosyltransferase involved in cell wall biosynthesis